MRPTRFETVRRDRGKRRRASVMAMAIDRLHETIMRHYRTPMNALSDTDREE